MVIQEIKLEGSSVIVRASGTYGEFAKLGVRVPNSQHDRLAQLDLTVYPCTLKKLDACKHLTDGQKQYIHKLYDAAVAKDVAHDAAVALV